MAEREPERRTFEKDDAEGDRAMKSLRQGVERVREQVRRLRRDLEPEARDER
jgi:hypothetical protein